MKKIILFIFSICLFYCLACKNITNQVAPPPIQPSMLTQVANSDTLFVHTFQGGCDYSFEEKTKIFLNYDKQLCYEFYCTTTNIPNGVFHPIAGFVPDSVKNTYALFEMGLKNLKDNPDLACTSHQNFTVAFGKDTIRTKENDCLFDDYRVWKEKLLGTANIDALKQQFETKLKMCN